MPDVIDGTANSGSEYYDLEITVGVSNRHIHVSAEDLQTLFGVDAELHKTKDLGQPGEFACQETLTVIGPRGVIEQVRVIGPVRSDTQVEVSMTDAFRLGYKPPVRDSGNLTNTPGVTIAGPKGVVPLSNGLILAQRHIHMATTDAKRHGFKNHDIVRVHFPGVRGIVFENVLIRVHDNFALEYHVDTDEANAALLKNDDKVKILR
jgi:putative phosphotransacetylase